MTPEHPRRLLREWDFRLYFLSNVVRVLPAQMIAVSVGWQVYSVRHHPFDLGLVGLAEFLPFPILALPAGQLADRISRRFVVGLALAVGVLNALLLLGVTLVYTCLRASSPFQTWFVARRHRDEVISLEYAGAETASPAPGVVDALDRADVILITPSNPYVSIHPILAVSDIRAALARRSVPCIAVSPVIAGWAVKGPVDRMLERLAGGTTPAHVAACYAGLIDALVIDSADAGGETAATRFVATDTLMTDRNAARRLAAVAIDAATAAAA